MLDLFRTSTRRPTLALEALEDRAVPSLFAGSDTVNTTPIRNSDAARVLTANASSSNGMHVVVWAPQSASKGTNIVAQLYDAGNHKVGGEVAVVANGRFNVDPSVGMDSAGNWVVSWTAIKANGDHDIRAARYSGTGQLLGAFSVSATADQEGSSSVAVAGDGSFVVAFTRQSGSNRNVNAVMYDPSGHALRRLAVAGSPKQEQSPSVAVGSGSNKSFSIAYQVGFDVYVNRYSATGSRLGTWALATTGAIEVHPRAAMDDRGDTVVVWQSTINNASSVRARTVNSAGQQGAVIGIGTGKFTYDPVTTDELGTEYLNPSVAMNRSTGSFVVACTRQNINDAADGTYATDTTDLVATEVRFAGGIRGIYLAGQMTVDPAFGRVFDGHPAVSIDATGHYVFTYCNVSDGINGTSAVLLLKGRLT